ncbi:MAG: cupin domain-containing protein [Desulfuromonadaceae bacterium]|nr:cupin domain-containing protein [Desulfuromonadaceae bacterium]
MFEKNSDDGYRQVVDGIRQKTLVHGDKTLMVEFRLQKGALLPLHSHPHEQTGYLIKGHIRLTIGSDIHDVEPGDSWCIPGNAKHSAEIMVDSIAVEVFSPVREEYLS